MSVIHTDGFDFYDHTTLGGRWTASGGPTITTSAARFAGGRGIRLGAGNHYFERPFGANVASGVFGFAFRWATTPRVNTIDLVNLVDSATNQCGVRITTTGTITVVRNGTTVFTGLSTYPADDLWHYIEIKWKIDNAVAAGEFEVLIDGATVLTSTGTIDTQNTANAYATHYRIGSGPNTSSQSLDFDDLYVKDDTTFIGEKRVYTLAPDGNGNSSQFTGSDGNSTDNYLLVDETPPNGDTDYVESSTVGHRDLYTFGSLSGVTGIEAVQVNAYARKTDAAARQINLTTRMSTTDYDSAAITLGSSFAIHSHLQLVRPSDAGAWTESDVNAAEFGVRVEA
jgi:hypothetical protein